MDNLNKKDFSKALTKVIGLKLRMHRIQKGLSLEVVSGLTGICYATLVNFEKANSNLNFGMVYRLCSVLGVEIQDVLPKVDANLNQEYFKLELEYKNLTNK